MPRFKLLLLLPLVAGVAQLPGRAFQTLTPADRDPKASEDTALLEIREYLGEISTAAKTADRGVNAYMEATARCAAQPGNGGGVCSSIRPGWVSSAASSGAESGRLFQEPEQQLSAWVTAVGSGADQYPPMVEIREQMAKWRSRDQQFLQQMSDATVLAPRVLAASEQLASLKPESEEWNEARRANVAQEENFTSTLATAQSGLESSFDIPSPLKPSDRTPSPFTGPVTPGTPERLWIWLRRPSAPIGETIEADIGLGNSKGPNVVADKDYPVSFVCQGCVIKDSRITINRGDRFVKTSVRLSAPKEKLTAQSSGLKTSQLTPYGCTVTDQPLTLVLQQEKAEGPADGVTPIPFDLIFEDSKGQPATDSLRKLYSQRVVGVGEIKSDLTAGEIGSFANPFMVPADECVAHKALVSKTVGEPSVAVAFLNKPSDPLKFRFFYTFPLLDCIFVLLGACLGSVANRFVLHKTSISWVWSFLSSVIGAFLLFMLCYLFILNKVSLSSTWGMALCFSLAGGVLGVSAAKLVAKSGLGSGNG
jgi:hypothetical protein